MYDSASEAQWTDNVILKWIEALPKPIDTIDSDVQAMPNHIEAKKISPIIPDGKAAVTKAVSERRKKKKKKKKAPKETTAVRS